MLVGNGGVMIALTRVISGALTGGLLAASLAGAPASFADSAGTASVEPVPVAQVQARESTQQVPTARGDRTDRLARFYAQRAAWSQCADAPDFECATVRVPRSYQKPRGATLKIALLRNAANNGNPNARSIVVNPGGPGASGTNLVANSLNTQFPAELVDRFNIVGMDPRGVGRSTQINCVTQAALAKRSADLPRTAKQQAAFLVNSKKMAKGCATRGKALVRVVGTQSAARDLDVVRSALGQKKLWYLGVSYGTYLGATYASLFPKRVGRTVLDAGLSPTVNMIGWGKAQTTGFQKALSRWADSCPEREECPFPGDRSAVVGELNEMLAMYNEFPLPSPSGKPIGDGTIRGLIQTALPGGESSWPLVDAIVSAADDGNTEVLEAIGNAFENAYGTPPTNLVSANSAVNCYDRPTSTSLKQMRKHARVWGAKASTFGASIAWSITSTCTYWPVRKGQAPPAVKSKTKQRIQMIGGTKDPLTPYKWTVELSQQIKNSRVLKFTGDGHGGLGKGSPCVDDAVTNYFITGKVTPKGARCS